jgi:hypothetical protein
LFIDTWQDPSRIGLVASFVFLALLLIPVTRFNGVKSKDWFKGFFVIFFAAWAIWILCNYARLSRKPLLFKYFTGLEITEFDTISREIESKYDQHEGVRLSRSKRKRGIGAGRPFKLKVSKPKYHKEIFFRNYAIGLVYSITFGQTFA